MPDTMPHKLKEFLESASESDLAESADQVKKLLEHMRAGACPACGVPKTVYLDDAEHYAASPDCPVAKFRPLIRKFLKQSKR